MAAMAAMASMALLWLDTLSMALKQVLLVGKIHYTIYDLIRTFHS